MIGVEPAAVDTLRRSLGIGKPVELPDDADPSKMMRIDGLYVPRLGDEVFRICTEISKQVYPVSLRTDEPRFRDGMERLRQTSDALGDAKARGGLVAGIQRVGLTLKAGATFLRLLLLPVDRHPLPADVRMEPRW